MSCRYYLCLLAFIGFCMVYMLRVNLSIALVAMVKDTGEDSSGSSDECDTQPLNTSNSGSKVGD